MLVAVVTSNTKLATAPGNVFIPASASGLPKDSVVNVTALLTLNKDELSGSVGSLPAGLLREVDAGLRRVLGI
ncbi:Endoribonuclease MazF6 [Nocardia sp. RB20]|uniref:Endoribonuclease MazF6 n=1 Tax=Nocardia macrotermitis TaxID=2585198 RepID=A0A7K0D2G4_9NOCA|nr:Endoribonuclease MazF6 [Nocardia macrotermitis]